MAGNSMQFRNPAGHAGLLNNLLALTNAVAGFFESRLALFGVESKSALAHVLVLAAALIAGVVLLAFGYVFLLASIIVGVANALRISWVWTSLAAAVLHFVLAFVCVMIAKNRMAKPMFPATAAELKRDREWLKNLSKENPSTN
jgi:uncharacterized membrane protein YqjE